MHVGWVVCLSIDPSIDRLMRKKKGRTMIFPVQLRCAWQASTTSSSAAGSALLPPALPLPPPPEEEDDAMLGPPFLA